MRNILRAPLTKIGSFFHSRGHLSVYVDVELHFGTTCPTDPLKPLKDVVFTEDCLGFICDLADAQIMPGKKNQRGIFSR